MFPQNRLGKEQGRGRKVRWPRSVHRGPERQFHGGWSIALTTPCHGFSGPEPGPVCETRQPLWLCLRPPSWWPVGGLVPGAVREECRAGSCGVRCPGRGGCR